MSRHPAIDRQVHRVTRLVLGRLGHVAGRVERREPRPVAHLQELRQQLLLAQPRPLVLVDDPLEERRGQVGPVLVGRPAGDRRGRVGHQLGHQPDGLGGGRDAEPGIVAQPEAEQQVVQGRRVAECRQLVEPGASCCGPRSRSGSSASKVVATAPLGQVSRRL